MNRHLLTAALLAGAAATPSDGRSSREEAPGIDPAPPRPGFGLPAVLERAASRKSRRLRPERPPCTQPESVRAERRKRRRAKKKRRGW